MKQLINRKVLISMLFIGLTMMGIVSYKHLQTELYPDAEYPTLSVSITSRTELDPKYIESQAAIPVEGVISGMEGVEEIETRITTTGAQIKVSFTKSTNTKYAYLKLEEKIKTLVQNLPEEFTVRVSKAGGSMASNQFMTLKILGDDDVDYVRNITDADIVPVLESTDGIASVTAMGGRQKSIEILLDQEKCKALNITASQISSLISKNRSEKTFAGSAFQNTKRYFVNVTAEYLQTEDLGNIVVAEGPILLKDIAEIHFGIKEEESYSRVNGKEVISCIIARSPLVNVIDLSDRVRKEIAKLNEELAAKGVYIQIDTDVAETMSENINTIINLGITGAILAIFILYLFLRNFKIVTFIAIAIPISVFSAFYFFYFFGITINTLTLTGIALSVGMLLDNSVVVMENIFRLRAIGTPSQEAAVQGTKEVAKAVIAATLTTITVFLPFVFSDDFLLKLIGEHVGISIITTLLLSLVVALLLIPMAVNQFMRKQGEQVNFSTLSIHSRPVQIYIALLKMCLRKPATVVFTSILILVITVALSLSLTLNTLKEIEADTFNIYMTFPNGNTLTRSDETVRAYEQRLNEIPEIEQYSSKIYPADGNVTIKLKENFEKIGKRSLNDLKSLVIGLTKGLRISDVSFEAFESSDNFQGGGGNALLGGSSDLLRKLGMGNQSEKIVIKGQDFEKMANLAELLKYQLEELDNISYSSYSTSRGKPEARIIFDQYLMGIYDVTPNNVVSELNNFAPQNTTSIKYKAGDQEYDIIIKDKALAEKKEEEGEDPVRNLEDLRNMEITTTQNALVDLRSFSRINLTRGQGNINRVNQDKEITVNYRFNSDVNESKNILEAARLEVDELVQNSDIPSGVAVEVIHEEDETSEFAFLILAAFLLIYMILASVFESLTAPIVLMFAIPLAAIGSLLALLFTSNSLISANVLTGFIILIGIVVNNSIILIDYTSQLRRQGNRKPRALIMAGISRLRPILITAITTIIAMFPLAMGQGEFVSGLGAPFAITVIGGLTTSTLLTLVIIPTLYSGLEDALQRLRTQSLFMKILQLSLIVPAIIGICFFTDSLLWRLGYLIGAIILVPGATWFIESSLRQANSRIIPPNEEIHISIRNLVKIYGRPNEFQREWQSGERTRERLGLQTTYRSLKDLKTLVWMLPVTGFLIYFTYFYQTLTFWAIFFAICTWWLTAKIILIGKAYFTAQNKRGVWGMQILLITVYYISPLFSLIWASVRFSDSGLPVLLGLFWYIGIAASYLANRIHKYNINIDLIEGRFRNLKKSIYRTATKIPVIGYKKKPFKALNAVSMDIHTGMFGLLGPNGAGKTTLMRIICGIFEQSYGKIFINGIDTQKKREELQGLIGYLPQEFGTYENLTSWEFLEYQALLKGIYHPKTRRQRITEVLEAVHMYENKDKKIGGFSGGMKQRIGIAQTLLNLPRILVVDEPTAGLDPRERIRFRNLLVELSRNRIVIFSTHIIEDIASSCNQVGVINKGSLKYYGTPTEMAEIAKDVTWTFEIPAREFAKLPADLLLVHHIRNGENIKVRCLCEKQPVPHAVHTAPLLEDSYLWLLRNVKLANNEQIITQ